jgi:hypothetical protein
MKHATWETNWPGDGLGTQVVYGNRSDGRRKSALGHSRRFDLLTITSGLPPTSDVYRPVHFASVPKRTLEAGIQHA